MMNNDSALSDLQPWNTSTTQPLNIMKAQIFVLSKMSNHKSMPKPVIAAQQIKEHRRKTFSQASHTRYRPKATTWNFQYRSGPQKKVKKTIVSDDKISKLLQKSSQTTQLKATQLSTQMTKSQLNQTECTLKFTPYNSNHISNHGLTQFTNSAIQQRGKKSQLSNKKVSFTQFINLKRKEAKFKKYPKKIDTNWNQYNSAIHVKYPQEKCISILQKNEDTNFSHFLEENKELMLKKVPRQERRRVISSKKCSSFKINMNPQLLKDHLSEDLRQFSLILPN